MKTLEEILEAVKTGETPDTDDLFYAVAALSHLLDHTAYDLLSLVEKGHPALAPLQEAHSVRVTAAMGRPPMLWLGHANDPRCREYQEWRQEAMAARRQLLH